MGNAVVLDSQSPFRYWIPATILSIRFPAKIDRFLLFIEFLKYHQEFCKQFVKTVQKLVLDMILKRVLHAGIQIQSEGTA